MKSGFVSIVGRPNVGKSTLINKILNKKIAITSDKVGTTRNIIYGIYNEENYQIVFIDTPGIHKADNKLGGLLNKKAFAMATDNELVLFLVDIASGFGKGDMKILDHLKEENKEVILVLNKVDLIDKNKLLLEISKLKDLYDFKEIVPISSLTGDNVVDLINSIKKYLKDDVKYFPDEVLTNVNEDFMIGEIIREKVLQNTKEEVPHSVTCRTELVQKKKGVYHINALIIVDRDNLKSIIIGKNGQMLKKIGTEARSELEAYLNGKVYLELFVKTIKNWRNSEYYLKDLGFDELDN